MFIFGNDSHQHFSHNCTSLPHTNGKTQKKAKEICFQLSAVLSGKYANDLRDAKCQKRHMQIDCAPKKFNIPAATELVPLVIVLSFLFFFFFVFSRPYVIVCVCTFAVSTIPQRSFTCTEQTSQRTSQEKKEKKIVPMKRREESNQTTKCQHSFLLLLLLL